MKDPIEIAELNKWLSKLPEIIRYKDGEEVVDCRLTFYFHNGDVPSWTAAYYCSEYDYFACCGYGKTIVEAVNHLHKVYRDARKRREEGFVGQ